MDSMWKRLVVVIGLVGLLTTGFLSARERGRERTLGPQFYLYGGLNLAHVPWDPWYPEDRDTQASPMVGAGFRFLDFSHRAGLSLNVDYSPVAFTQGRRDIDIWNAMVTFEHRFGRRSPWIFFTGLGFSWLDYKEPWSNTLSVGIWEGGFMVDLSPRIRLRFSFRTHFEPGETWVWVDDWGVEIEEVDPALLIGTALTVGIQVEL